MNPYRDPPGASVSPAWVLALRDRHRRHDAVRPPLDLSVPLGPPLPPRGRAGITGPRELVQEPRVLHQRSDQPAGDRERLGIAGGPGAGPVRGAARDPLGPALPDNRGLRTRHDERPAQTARAEGGRFARLTVGADPIHTAG